MARGPWKMKKGGSTYGKTTGIANETVKCRKCGDESQTRKKFQARHWIPKHVLPGHEFNGRPCASFKLKEGRRLTLDEVAIHIGGQVRPDPPIIDSPATATRFVDMFCFVLLFV